MFEIGFLCPKSGKETEKIDFGAERNGLQAKHFLKWNCLLPLFFLYFKCLLMLAMLIAESCL